MFRSRDSRCPLFPTVEASFAGLPVHVAELGRYTALLEHDVLTNPGRRAYFSFRAGGELFMITAEVVRSRVDRDRTAAAGRLKYRTEVSFGDLSEATASHLEELLAILSPGDPRLEAHTEALQFEIVGV